MQSVTTEAMLGHLDRGRLDARYWTLFALLAVGAALDFFDFFVVGYLVAVVGPQWHLTYGQSSLMLLGGGLGAICGALVWGPLSDAWGRKAMLVAGSFVCAIAAGSIALVRDGDWMTFAVLRFFVGVGLAGCATAITALIVEYTPTRNRTVVTSLLIVFATFGSFLAALTSANLLGVLGWRGVATLGLVPALMGFVYIFALPESARWLAVKGRFADARTTVAWTLRAPLDTIPLPTVPPPIAPRASLSELLHHPRLFAFVGLTWLGLATAIYGMLLWGPTVVALLLGITPRQAAAYFVYVTAAGLTGKVLFSFLAQWLGRKRCGEVTAYGAAVALALAAYSYEPVFMIGVPVFVLAMIVTSLFLEGEASNITPWAVEAYGVRLGARAAGLSQAANGCGKVVGPLCLALIAGADNFVSPKATAQAVTPAFLFLAACMLLVGLACTFLGPETAGKPIAQDTAPGPLPDTIANPTSGAIY
ncbi:MFS transporter [Rhodopila sp.]|uniref:MFS transporter n=1 Tax=Rhodopila sp. TaxID=2480087 RepID=UPI003D12A56A